LLLHYRRGDESYNNVNGGNCNDDGVMTDYGGRGCSSNLMSFSSLLSLHYLRACFQLQENKKERQQIFS